MLQWPTKPVATHSPLAKIVFCINIFAFWNRIIDSVLYPYMDRSDTVCDILYYESIFKSKIYFRFINCYKEKAID